MKNYDVYSDEELIGMLRAGDSDIANYLMEKYKGLVRKKARALYLAGGDHEDLLQEGMLGLFKAVQEFQQGKETSFYTYASTCVANQMYKAVVSSKRQKHQMLNNSLSLNELEEESSWDLVNPDSPEKILLEQEQSETLSSRIRKALSSFEQQVLEMYLEGDDYIQIGQRLGKSPKSIDNALQRIRKKVRELGKTA